MSTRRSEAREKAALLHKQQEAAAKRQRTITITSVAVVALLIVGVMGFLLVRDNDAPADNTVAAPGPSGLVDNAIVRGEDAAPVTLTIYEDLQCPACKNFETTTGSTVDELREDGTVQVEYRTLSFLDSQSTTEYSSRALNALACVQDTSPDAVLPFKKALYEQQPSEGGDGLPDDRLISIAQDAGAGDVDTCITDKTYEEWLRETTAKIQRTVSSTPTVLVNGNRLTDTSPAGLEAAVEAAEAAA